MKEEFLKKFEENVEYLKRNIPPDDIYIFAEQTLMGALFFMKQWSDWIDLEEECKNDIITRKWVENILGFYSIRDSGKDVDLDLRFKDFQ